MQLNHMLERKKKNVFPQNKETPTTQGEFEGTQNSINTSDSMVSNCNPDPSGNMPMKMQQSHHMNFFLFFCKNERLQTIKLPF
uniref:Uncharacterized protein n=1 Tax=Rhizophora mucronata TaxID=61149 RepID=A0A2P2PR98_RHIMU